MINTNCVVFILIILMSAAANAEDTFELTIKDHKYTPEVLNVKANEKFKIKVKNEDSTSEEFESRSLVIEKFIGPKNSATVILGPLKPGTYDFFGDFHKATAKGVVIAK